jgi:mscS mechanosensitive ion channel
MDLSLIFLTLFFGGIFIVVDFAFKKLLDIKNNLINQLLRRAARVIIIIFALLAFAKQYGLLDELTSTLLTNSALIVAVIGFLLQNTLKNILAGALLLSSETFKIGDRIRLPNEKITGTIELINMRHTTIALPTNEQAIIPNSLLNDAIVINNDLHGQETSYPLIITLSVKEDLEKARTLVREVITNHPNVLNKQDETIFTSLTNSTIELKTMIETKDIQTSFSTISELRLQVVQSLKENGFFNV